MVGCSNFAWRGQQGALAVLLVLVSALVSGAASAEDEFRIAIEGHRFQPEHLSVPAGQRFRIVVENHDPTPEEFESYALNREKLVPGGASITLYVGPLKAGRYEFFGDFNQSTARGWLVAGP